MTKDSTTQKLLEKVFGVNFDDGVTAKREGLILRKEIILLLKSELE